MKLVVAVIKPFKLDEVREALIRLEIPGMTVAEVKGRGRQQGTTDIRRGVEHLADFVPKIRLEVAVTDGQVAETVEAIRAIAHTGGIGDGKIFVVPIDDAIRIRTAETGDDAL